MRSTGTQKIAKDANTSEQGLEIDEDIVKHVVEELMRLWTKMRVAE